MNKRTCVIDISPSPDICKRFYFHKRDSIAVKRLIVRFIFDLISTGYHHFIICFDDRMSFRVAETLYFLSINGNAPPITYSLSLWNEESGRYDEQLNDERFFDNVLRHAKKLYWRYHSWYDSFYPVEVLNLGDASPAAADANDIGGALREIAGCDPRKLFATSMHLRKTERNGMSVKDLLAIYLDPNNYRELSRYAVKLTGNMDDAEDLLGDLIIAIYTKPEFLSAQEPLAYFKTCMRNSWVNREKRSTKIAYIDPELIGMLSKSAPEYQRELEDRETLSELQKMLSNYAPDLVDAFTKFHLEGYGLQELAAILGMKPNSLAKQFGRMRDKIREKAPLVWGLMMLAMLGRCAV